MEREHITPQGVSVFHDKNENIHSFCLCLYVRAGSLFETKENNGISHFFEHIVFKNIHYQMGENLYQTLDRCGLDLMLPLMKNLFSLLSREHRHILRRQRRF